MRAVAAAAAMLVVLPAISAALPAIRLRQKPGGERVLVDEFGRERAFHGTNAVVKGPPWIPSRGSFDGLTSLVKEDFEYMRQAGLNVIRLGVMWPGVEPVRGTYNATYLKVVTDIAQEAAEYGIYTLADMHQDVLSERFCGEGVPAWASEPETVAPFPLPLKPAAYPTDPATGFPTRQACTGVGSPAWDAYQATPAAGSAYERLYTNYDNLTDAWGSYWAQVAQAFRGAPELLGLELINEPFIGNPYKNPLHLLPDLGDRQRLQPAYDVVAAHIRAVAPDALVFFAGCTWDRTGNAIVDALPLGFTHPPGGAEYADRSVAAYHYYEPPQDKTKTQQYLQQRLRDARRLGTGLFLTEACCGSLVDRAAPAAEALGLSWVQWEWKDFCSETAATRGGVSQNAAFGACKTGYGGGPFPGGVLDRGALRRLARTYAPAIAGNFTSAQYDDYLHIYILQFAVDPAISAPTVVSAPKLAYPAGVSVTVTPPGVLRATQAADVVELRPTPAARFGDAVTVMVCPAAIAERCATGQL